MCDKSAYRKAEPPVSTPPKSADELIDEYDRKHKKGKYASLLEDYFR